MLFDIIPEIFFSPLASPGKIVYWECICRLFAVTSQQISFGVERDVLVDELQYYFDLSMSADIQEEELKDVESISSRDKANFMLRKLKTYGWIDIEVDYSYVERVTFRDYAVKIIKTLLAVEQEQKTEYQGYIYSIYDSVRANGVGSGQRLLKIYEDTDALITGLKSLNANIKRYIDELTKHSTVAEILDALLNDYYTNVVDKAYHRLLTSDNLSKFRPEIIERLEVNSKSRRFLNIAAKEIAEIKEISSVDAEEMVLDLLHEVVDAFRNMDEILEEINKKNTRYQKAAVNRAKFLLSSSDDIRGQLKEILIFINEQIQEKNWDYNAVYELEEMDGLIKIFAWSYLDIDSLYAPTEGKKEFVPQEVNFFVPDIEARNTKRLKIQKKLANVLSPEKIDAYVKLQLAGRERMLVSELPLAEEDTFIRIIYIHLYGRRKKVSYWLDFKDIIEKDGFRFRDFEIIRKR